MGTSFSVLKHSFLGLPFGGFRGEQMGLFETGAGKVDTRVVPLKGTPGEV